MVFTMANVGLPGTSGFVGEFLTIVGVDSVRIPGTRWYRGLILVSLSAPDNEKQDQKGGF